MATAKKPAHSNPWTDTASATPAIPATVETEPLYDLEGLMTDFPTARELEKFVYDQTGHVLSLKGRSNKFKYSTAMDVLNGKAPEEYMKGTENPYLDKNELIPVDQLKALPARPQEVADQACVSTYISKTFPHPDPEWAATGQKCEVVFRKYVNNAITYEVLGPIAPRAVGTRVNKFGKEVPEKFAWVDPRTGEQLVRYPDGRVTPRGSVLRAQMQKSKINNKSYWDVWIDREFVMGDTGAIDNPWNVA